MKHVILHFHYILAEGIIKRAGQRPHMRTRNGQPYKKRVTDFDVTSRVDNLLLSKDLPDGISRRVFENVSGHFILKTVHHVAQ